MQINYEKKYKKLEKSVKGFLDGYVWDNCEMAEDMGIGVGYFNDEDAPKHVKEVNNLYEIMANKK